MKKAVPIFVDDLSAALILVGCLGAEFKFVTLSQALYLNVACLLVNNPLLQPCVGAAQCAKLP